jgi:hypothetical protein
MDINSLIPIACFVAGLLVGVGAMLLGLWLGFKASYDIRNHREGFAGNTDGLVTTKADDGEMELID